MTALPREFALHQDWWIQADEVFCGEILSSGKALRILDGRVSQVADQESIPPGAVVWQAQGCITPGFFDIQVNGGGGALFNADPTASTIKKIAKAHRNFGTTRFLPTVITDEPGVMEQAAAAVAEMFGSYGVQGLHIEGPHISIARRGTHAEKYIRPLDALTFRNIRALRDQNIPVLITLAPESATAQQVSELVEMGVIVSIGHSDADAEAAQTLVDAGVKAFTHLFNAMSPMLNRAPGVTGTAINSEAYCSFICDGIHVDDQMLALAIRARPLPDRMILISDAMPTVGGPDCFELYGRPVTLENGALVNSDGSLAGAHISISSALARAVANIGIPMDEALRMAISNPARLMGQAETAQLQGSLLESLVLIRDDLGCIPLTSARLPVPG